MTALDVEVEPLRSTLTDPDLADLVEMFIAELPSRIDALQASAASCDWDQLASLGHQLKGASGSYGFAPLGAVCARVERIAQRGGADDLPAVLNELAELERRICG